MNRKPWIASVSGMAIASLVLVVSPANASDYAYTSARNKPVYDYARVVDVEPVIRYVTVTTPVKKCWEDVEYTSVRNYRPARVGKTLNILFLLSRSLLIKRQNSLGDELQLLIFHFQLDLMRLKLIRHLPYGTQMQAFERHFGNRRDFTRRAFRRLAEFGVLW